MSAPGQDLSELIQHMSEKDIVMLVGDDLVRLLNAMPGIADQRKALETLAVRFLHDRAEELLGSPKVRQLLFSCMSVDKQHELVKRLGVPQLSALNSLDANSNPPQWQHFLGFFGIDAQFAAHYLPEPTRCTISAMFDLFPYQKGVADRAFNVAQDSHGRAVVHMPTGAGKTRTAMHLICRYLNSNHPSVVVWLAASSELLDQAADAFQMAWHIKGDRSVNLVRIWGAHSPADANLDDGLIVGGFAKMYSHMKRNPIAFLRLAQKVKLVIVDEAHQSIAPTYRELIDTLTGTGPNHSLLGLTATPGRTWTDVGADAELAEYFGDRKIGIEVEGYENPVEYLIQKGYLAKPKFNRLRYEISETLQRTLRTISVSETDYADEALESLAEDTARNTAIISEIERMIAAGHHRIILFGASVRHAETLAAILAVKGIDSRVVTAQTNTHARRHSIDGFKHPSKAPMVMCNYGVLTTGFDAPKTSAAVIARPTRSLVLYSQMVGRATRGPKAGGNATCEISTVVDISLPGFGDMEQAFSNWEDVWNE
jgi:superfamily II DNA or RNA helicase